MLQEIILMVLAIMSALAYFFWPMVRHYYRTKNEREQLEKRYNRIWRSRRDLLVSQKFSFHLYRFLMLLT